MNKRKQPTALQCLFVFGALSSIFAVTGWWFLCGITLGWFVVLLWAISIPDRQTGGSSS